MTELSSIPGHAMIDLCPNLIEISFGLQFSNLQVFGQPQHLYGHSDEITALHVSRPYSIMVSASRDATCIIWDLNR